MSEGVSKKERFWTNALFWILLTVGVAAVGFAIYCNVTGYRISFSNNSCAFPYYLHLYCPGCGGTRAVRFLLEGKFVQSFLAHPFVMYLFILYIQCLLMSGYSVLIKRDGVFRTRIYIWQIVMMLVIVVGFFVIRNLLLVFAGYDFLGECISHWS